MALSPYQTIGQPIETNHFGDVYQGLEFAAQRDVRMIVAHERFAADAERWDKVWDDVLAMIHCQHQNLVAVYNVDKSQRTIVTEWLPSDLQQAATTKSLSTGDVRQVLHQALDGLAEIHQRGLVHGDVRPANLQLTGDQFVKLAFSPGLAFGGEYHRREIGNRFAAPELLNPAFGEINAAADLYGLGMSALALLVGARFDKKFRVSGKHPAELEQAWMHWQASADEEVDVDKTVSGLPADVRQVIHRLTRKHVDQRYSSAAEAQADLETSESQPLESVPIAAPPTPQPAGATATRNQSPGRSAAQPTATASKNNDTFIKAAILLVTLALLAIIIEPWTWFGGEPEGDVDPQVPPRFAADFVTDPADAEVQLTRLSEDEGPQTVDPPESGPYQLLAGKYRVTATRDQYEPCEHELVVPDGLEDLSPIVLTPLAITTVPDEPKVDPADELEQSLGLQFVLVTKGSFLMGLPDDQQPTEIENDYYLAAHEVTVGQYRAFVADAGYETLAQKTGGRGYVDGSLRRDVSVNWQNPGFLEQVDGDMEDLPVVQIAWEDAAEFCRWLTSKSGRTYRLPSEAEWEYACRAGTTTLFATGDELADTRANIDGVFGRAVKVGSYPANAWGLFDMHGNVQEWCQDSFSESTRVLRGGGWDDSTTSCRSGSRRGQVPEYVSSKTGFRIVREVE